MGLVNLAETRNSLSLRFIQRLDYDMLVDEDGSVDIEQDIKDAIVKLICHDTYMRECFIFKMHIEVMSVRVEMHPFVCVSNFLT